MSRLAAAYQAWRLTWRAILGDKAALLLFFISGIVYSFFYPLPYSGETVRRVPVAVVDQDGSALSRQLIRWAGAHPGLSVAGVTTRPEQAQEWIWRGDAAGVMLIPADFSSKLLAGRQPEVEVGGIGAYPLLNKVALNGLAEVVGTLSAGIELKRLGAGTPSAQQAAAQRQPLSVEALPMFNVSEGYASYIVPGVVVLLMQQTFLLGTMYDAYPSRTLNSGSVSMPSGWRSASACRPDGVAAPARLSSTPADTVPTTSASPFNTTLLSKG